MRPWCYEGAFFWTDWAADPIFEAWLGTKIIKKESLAVIPMIVFCIKLAVALGVGLVILALL